VFSVIDLDYSGETCVEPFGGILILPSDSFCLSIRVAFLILLAEIELEF
jgi:hypothetical protein